MVTIKSIKIDIQMPTAKELQTKMDNAIKQMQKYGKIDMALDVSSFNKSLAEMSNSLMSLKDKLSSFGVLDEVVNSNKISKGTSAISNLNKEVDNYGKTMDKVSKKTIITDAGVTTQTKLQESMAKTMEITERNGEVTKQVFTTNQKVIDDFVSKMQGKLGTAMNNGLIDASVLNDLQAKLNAVNTDSTVAEINELKASITNLSSQDSSIVRLQNAIANIGISVKNASTKYGSLINDEDVRKSTEQVNMLKQAITDIQSGKNISGTALTGMLNSANNSTKDMVANARNAGSALKLATKDATSFGQAIQASLGKVGIYTSTAIVMRQMFNAFKDGVAHVQDLDKAFFNIRATMDITESQFEGITVEAQKMAKNLATTTKSVMDIIQVYSNASTDLDTVLEKAQGSAILSNITSMDSAETTKIIQSTINAFKMLDEEGTTATDAVNRISDSIVEISRNMAYDFGKTLPIFIEI